LTICYTVGNPPLTTFTTPFGRPTSYSISINLLIVAGTLSDGFRTKVFPRVMAIGYIHNGHIAGKLNGVTPAQTPRGTL